MTKAGWKKTAVWLKVNKIKRRDCAHCGKTIKTFTVNTQDEYIGRPYHKTCWKKLKDKKEIERMIEQYKKDLEEEQSFENDLLNHYDGTLK